MDGVDVEVRDADEWQLQETVEILASMVDPSQLVKQPSGKAAKNPRLEDQVMHVNNNLFLVPG